MKSWRSEKSAFKISEVTDTTSLPIPEQLSNWLGELILLGEVPLAYLVSDERELPMESIRFFVVDPLWTQALVEGATSIGISTKDEALYSAKNLPRQYMNAKKSIRIPRYSKMHPNHRRKNVPLTADSNSVLSGFFMRSDLVSNWKGIEVKGFYEDAPRDILRMEKLSDKLLICIFEGEIDVVKMYEPKEALHFGTRGLDRKMDIRRVDEGHEGEPLYQAGTKKKVSLTVPTESNGRVRISELRKSLAKALDIDANTIESPQLALEMLSVAGECEFKYGGNSNNYKL